MTSRQYTEQTGRSEPRVPRRGVVKRGILPSFGDIILPIVSIAAVVLLVLAGRQFFVNGMKTSPGMSSTRAYAEAPALIAEREERERREMAAIPAPVVEVQEAAPVSAEVAAVILEEKDDTSFAAVAERLMTTPTPQPASVKASAPAPAQKATTTKTTPKASTLPANKQWRVQVGAYGSRSGAQKEADRINKAGYKATVYSNPASKYVKVWVLGGADKASAEKVAEALQKMGYKGSFAFPPPQTK